MWRSRKRHRRAVRAARHAFRSLRSSVQLRQSGDGDHTRAEEDQAELAPDEVGQGTPEVPTKDPVLLQHPSQLLLLLLLLLLLSLLQLRPQLLTLLGRHL